MQSLQVAISSNAAVLSATNVAVSSTVTAISGNYAMITTLRTAIIAAANTGTNGGSGGASITSDDGVTLTVTSGNCAATDLCTATSFANALKSTLTML